MIQKLEKLCCKTDAEMLSRYVFIVNRPKTENETVYYNVDYIHTAIYENKQIKFHYAEVTLECRNELAGVVSDRFGHAVWMCPHGEEHFRARVPVAVSSEFFGWITGIGPRMRIVGPEDVRQQYKEYLQNVIQNYMD